MRRLLSILASAGLVAAAVTAIAVLGPGAESSTRQATPVAARASIDDLQQHLADQPRDAASWASLGHLYLDRSRTTGDAAYYAKAEGAFAQSLQHQPQDNDRAVAGQAALAAARHDFTTALAAADAALAINAMSPEALAARTDALTELGRYDEALVAAEQADGTRPSLSTFTRLAYQHELRGDLDTARRLFKRSLENRPARQDTAFVRFHLGEIARASGDLDAAATEYDAALSADPEHVASLAATARLAAARGDRDKALDIWADVVARAPLPSHLTAYGELLAATGRVDEAEQQFEAVRASYAIAASYGSIDDLEVAVFEADHGDPAAALAAAEREWSRRQSVHVADAYAWALHVNGRHAEALVMADRALALGSVDPEFARHREAIVAAIGTSA